MKPKNATIRFAARAAAASLLLSAVSTLHAQVAQSDTTNIRAMVEHRLKLEKEIQEKQAAWSAERSEMLAWCTALEEHIKYLTERQATDAEVFSALSRDIDKLQGELSGSRVLEDSLQATMDSLYNVLQRSVDDGVPFRVRERQSRLSDLKTELSRSDVEPGEKLRKLLDAFQLEAAYGMTTDVFEREVSVDGELVPANVLRIGHVALFWRSADGKRVGRFERSTRTWVTLPGKYEGNIGRAIEMALRERPIEVLSLPFGEVQP
jgi:hypothetical protein